jgi:hypothetical protein
MSKKVMTGVAVALAVIGAGVATYLVLAPNAEAKAAGRLQSCWEARKRDPARKCMAETEEFLAACQKSSARQACIDRVGKLLSH